jgi:acetyl-CoA acetyltransferase
VAQTAWFRAADALDVRARRRRCGRRARLSRRFLERVSPEARARALRVRGWAFAGGKYAPTPDEPKTAEVAAKKAYAAAGASPRDIDLVELHDATSFATVHLVEDLGLCPRGEGGRFLESGATRLGGEVPVNLSGGLVARGHPIGATGLIMLNEARDSAPRRGGDMQSGAAIGLRRTAAGSSARSRPHQ